MLSRPAGIKAVFAGPNTAFHGAALHGYQDLVAGLAAAEVDR
jgi:hypothetical protein